MKYLTLILGAFVLSTASANAHEKCSCATKKRTRHHAHTAATTTKRTRTYVKTSTQQRPTVTYVRPVSVYVASEHAGSRARRSHLSIGPVLGLGGSWVSDIQGGSEATFSPALGIGLVYSHSEHFGIGTQLLVSREGYKADQITPLGTRQEIAVHPVYIRIPVQFTYFFGRIGDRVRPKIYAGPSIAFKVDESTRYGSSDGRPMENGRVSGDQFRTFDAGLTGGIGANFRVGSNTWLNTDIGYYHGLTDVLENGTYGRDNENRNLRLNVGLLWGL